MMNIQRSQRTPPIECWWIEKPYRYSQSRSLARRDTQVKRTSLIPPLKYFLNIWGLRGDGTDGEMVATALGAALEPPPTYQW